MIVGVRDIERCGKADCECGECDIGKILRRETACNCRKRQRRQSVAHRPECRTRVCGEKGASDVRYGNTCPERAFTAETSEPSMVPEALMSKRAVVPLTGCPMRAFTPLISLAFTARERLESPT